MAWSIRNWSEDRWISGSTLSVALAIAIGAGCLLIPVLINGFPFLYPDSADYLRSLRTPTFRSPFYGLFILFFHLNHFIWAPIVPQALIVSHLMWVLTRIYAGEYWPRWFGVLILILCLFSSLPFFVGFIMADIFTGVMILVFFLLSFHRSSLSKLEFLYFLGLACVAVAAHISHLPQAFALAVLAGILNLLLGHSLRFALRATGILVVPLGLSLCATLTYNTLIHHVFALYPSGETSLLANMIEQGPARRYLNDVCPAAGFKLCGVLNILPTRASQVFVSFYTLPELGGLDSMRDEAHKVVAGTIRSRPWEVLGGALRNIGRSFLVSGLGTELNPYVEWWMVDLLAYKFGPDTMRAYKASLQSRAAIPRDLLRTINNIAFPVAVLALLTSTLYALRRGVRDAISLSVFVVLAFAINNVVCSVGSGLADRYVARVTWLLPLCAILIVARLFRIDEARPSRDVGAIQEASPASIRQIPARRSQQCDGG